MPHIYSSLCPSRKQYPALGGSGPFCDANLAIVDTCQKASTEAAQSPTFAALVCWPELRILSTPTAQEAAEEFHLP